LVLSACLPACPLSACPCLPACLPACPPYWCYLFACLGLRIEYADRHTDTATGCFRNGTCVHVCHAQAPTPHHQTRRQDVDSRVPQRTGKRCTRMATVGAIARQSNVATHERERDMMRIWQAPVYRLLILGCYLWLFEILYDLWIFGVFLGGFVFFFLLHCHRQHFCPVYRPINLAHPRLIALDPASLLPAVRLKVLRMMRIRRYKHCSSPLLSW
jgi:hypothetical protein